MEEGSVCMPNIGKKERKKRLVFGAIALVVAAIVTGVLILLGAHRAWRVLAFLPFWSAALGYYQARGKT